MGLLSSAISLTRYRIEGSIDDSILNRVKDGLKKHAFPEIEEEDSAMTVGWTSLRTPYQAHFDDSSFLIGTAFVFSLRIDKKIIPPKIIKKQIALETSKRLSETGRTYVSKLEKQAIKDQVMQVLSSRIPATPNIYDIVWNYEAGLMYCFSTLKSANEELESLFFKSFNLTPIRLFPYTLAHFMAGLSHRELDTLNKLVPAEFME